MRLVLLLFLIFANLAVASAEVTPLYLASVIGVAADDRLNIRAFPDADAEILGSLAPDSVVDVVTLDPSGKWALVSPESGSGWVAARFLVTLPLREQPDSAYPYALPSALSCIGLEPAWDAALSINNGFTTFEDGEGYILYQNAEGGQARSTPIHRITSAMGRHLDKFAFAAGRFSGVITREYCEESATGNIYAWAIDFTSLNQERYSMFSGCCRTLQP